ncbi:MAG: hypothetical protein COZ72_06620 [Elusimicrobia bacterium CG_4_8_14_3_um_filter_50_9]|nr:MAG: hypothetical protein COZ72_06620 [Elusimicrobia bacterium CG_4_8_14_3_um_filter_50_9]
MSRWLPCKRRNFIRKLIKLNFNGPYSGTRHQFLIYKEHRLNIPSNSEYSVPQLKMMLNEVKGITGSRISLDEWEKL